MKSIFVLLLLTLSAFAQQETAAAAVACGPKGANFDVKSDESQHVLPQLEPGKALVVFVQDIGLVSCLGHCGTTKIGLDGAWVGANQHNSYFSVSVEPGEHHVCASPQGHFVPTMTSSDAAVRSAFAHFTAEAGKVYYFRVRRFGFGGQYQELFDLDAIDSDQGKYLIAWYPLSVSHQKP
jgi:hypothetical protein